MDILKLKEKSNVHIDDDKLLENYKTIWTKTEELRNIDLNALQVYYDRYRKRKLRTYSDNLYSNFCGLNAPEDGVESFTITSIDSLFAHENKYYLQHK